MRERGLMRAGSVLARTSVLHYLQQARAKHGGQTFLVVPAQPNLQQPRRQSLTFAQTYVLVQRVAQALAAKHGTLPPGTPVALFLDNGVAFVAAFFACQALGFIPALLNTQLKGDALRHSLSVAQPRFVLVETAEARDLIRSVLALHEEKGGGDASEAARDKSSVTATTARVDDSDANMAGNHEGTPVLLVEDLFEHQPFDPTRELQCRHVPRLSDPACLIFTSGTTGLPKAADMPHVRMHYGTRVLGRMIPLEKDDRVLLCLPLFHSAGLLPGLMNCLSRGLTVVLMRRFSASRVWPTVHDEAVTAFQ